MVIDRSVRKYLAAHADAHSQVADAIADAMAGAFEHGVMIPAFAEGEALIDALVSIPAAAGGVFVVVVVNRPDDACREHVARHDGSLRAIHARWPRTEPTADLPAYATLHQGVNRQLLVLDVRVPRRRGVGLARKIGCDVLLRLWARGTLRQPWLHMGDADSRWPADFFGRPVFVTPVDPAPAALIRTYVHEAAAEPHAEACLRYEARLRHHVLGLRWAGSAYAYDAIGSTISCHALAYAQVRGVPRRAAGEDFYLLNKLAKVGAITTVRGAPMRLSGRVSDRVPFGTGAALTAAVASAQLPRCYEPRIFALLRTTLAALDWALVEGCDLAAAMGAVWRDGEMGPGLLEVWRAGVVERGLAQLVAEVQATGWPLAKRRRRLREQVDAFGTLKLMHAWRGRGLPDVTMEDAVARSAFCRAVPAGASVAVVVRELAGVELAMEFGA